MDARSIWTLLALMIVSGPLEVRAQGYRPDMQCRLTPTMINEQRVGGRATERQLVLTENNTASDALVILGGRLRFASTTVSSNAYLYFDSNIGFVLGSQLKVAPGGATFTDYLASSQQDRPISTSQTHGFGIICRAALTGTCGAGTIIQGTTQCLEATATSRTRYCTCTSNGAGSPTYAWALDWGAGTVGDATTCPEVTP